MNRPPYRQVHEVVGYLYRGAFYHPACVIETMIAAGDASPAARDMAVDDVLDQCAGVLGIDRADETSFDSSELPKVVFLADVASDDRCERCNEPF